MSIPCLSIRRPVSRTTGPLARLHLPFPVLGPFLVLGLCLLITSCSSDSGETSYVAMGEAVTLGSVSHTVLSAEWSTGLGNGAASRVPQDQFLTIRMVLANTGDTEAEIASMQLVAADGTEYEELADGSGLLDWLGLVRTLPSKESRQGSVLFDAPRGVYSLKLTEQTVDGSDADVAYVEIPLRLDDNAIPTSADPTANPIR
jgi:hypothetical protein